MQLKTILRRTALPALAGLGLAFTSGQAGACSAEPYLGAVCTTSATYCPRGYTEANGQILSISQFSALFAIMGTTYGGDGRVTFALPDLRARYARGVGTGIGLGTVLQGQRGGQERLVLSSVQMPPHTHSAFTSVQVDVDSRLRANSSSGDSDSPDGNVLAKRNRTRVYSTQGPNADMNGAAVESTATAVASTQIGSAGGGQSTPILDPWLGLRYCVAVEGLFPPRN